MRISSIIRRIEDEGIHNSAKYYVNRAIEIKNKEPEPEPVIPSEEEILKILLLTNRDSDNVGDQVIEACDISLISAVMANLGISKEYFRINSRAASIVSQKYLSTRDEKLLKTAINLIKESDIVIFGGAPVFNYRYQNFYERTAVTLEIAQQYNKPVIFSAIGVDGYEDGSEKCRRLKKTLNFDCVKQITTRDDFSSLQNFIDNGNIKIGKVSDPALFTAKVFENFAEWNSMEDKKKVGIFILRSNGFVDNGYNFTRNDAADFWEDIVRELEDNGYDYEILTSGHFGDEAFLDYLIKNRNIDAGKCVFNINYPEKLIQKISTYDAVISCRLHPSIISYSLDVPSFGIVWNSKVNYFYESIGHQDRIVDVRNLSSKDIVERIGQAISEGVKKDEKYLISVYNSLFYGIKDQTQFAKDEIKPYSFEELLDNIPAFKGTSEKEKDEKLKRKFRRAYGKYNEVFDKNIQNREIANGLQAKYEGYTVIYNGGLKSDQLCWDYDEISGEIQRLGTGGIEYRLRELTVNDGKYKLLKNQYKHPNYDFLGWRMRIKDNEIWYWYLEDKTFKLQMDYIEGEDKEYYLFKDEDQIPYFQLNYVTTIVFEAVWKVKEPESL